METKDPVPMLFPYEPGKFLEQIREIIHEEVGKANKPKVIGSNLMETPGLTQKPLYKIAEICQLFKVSRTTVHDWVKHGKKSRDNFRNALHRNLMLAVVFVTNTY